MGLLQLPDEMKTLLHDCLEKRKPELLPLILNGSAKYIDDNLGNEIRDILIYELLEEGFSRNLLNEHGDKLDQLITALDQQVNFLIKKDI